MSFTLLQYFLSKTYVFGVSLYSSGENVFSANFKATFYWLCCVAKKRKRAKGYIGLNLSFVYSV